MTFVEQVKSQYDGMISLAGAGERRFREEAWAQYSRQGLPGRKTETWKYSNLNSLTKSGWPLNKPLSDASILSEVEMLREKWGLQFDIAVILDGSLRADLSHMKIDGVQLRPVDLDSISDFEFEDGWIGLSVALARPGFYLEVSGKTDRPLLLIQAQSSGTSWSPAVNQIRVNDGGRLNLASIFIGPRARYLRSEVTAVELGASAELHWARVQQDDQEAFHFSEVQSRLAAGAKLHLTQLNGGSAWCRSSLRSQIRGELAEAHIHGLTFGRGHQHIDQRIEVRHSVGNSLSSQLFKGVLKDSARGILNGKIAIEQGAQKVSSSQLNHNMLLSKTCEADTKPELEIYADDVKANHGASVGRLDENKMFYLMSRGITRRTAQEMLAHAFVTDVLMKIEPRVLRSFADESVRGWLPDFMSGLEATV